MQAPELLGGGDHQRSRRTPDSNISVANTLLPEPAVLVVGEVDDVCRRKFVQIEGETSAHEPVGGFRRCRLADLEQLAAVVSIAQNDAARRSVAACAHEGLDRSAPKGELPDRVAGPNKAKAGHALSSARIRLSQIR